jgi:lantibiotic modifying enzyme
MQNIKRLELTKLLDSFKHTTDVKELKEIKEKIYSELEIYLHKQAFAQFFKIERLTKNFLDDYIESVKYNSVDKEAKEKMISSLQNLEDLLYVFHLE